LAEIPEPAPIEPLSPPNPEALLIPPDQVSPRALQGMIEEFVTRDGTDYGERETDLAEKVAPKCERNLSAARRALCSFRSKRAFRFCGGRSFRGALQQWSTDFEHRSGSTQFDRGDTDPLWFWDSMHQPGIMLLWIVVATAAILAKIREQGQNADDRDLLADLGL
jgi:uncharacterized protein YheU (UPF0270 family)